MFNEFSFDPFVGDLLYSLDNNLIPPTTWNQENTTSEQRTKTWPINKHTQILTPKIWIEMKRGKISRRNKNQRSQSHENTYIKITVARSWLLSSSVCSVWWVLYTYKYKSYVINLCSVKEFTCLSNHWEWSEYLLCTPTFKNISSTKTHYRLSHTCGFLMPLLKFFVQNLERKKKKLY